MCGIVGYVGGKRETSFLIDALSKLEYRGYDSAGIAKLSDGKIVSTKRVGSIKNLAESVPKKDMVNVAISHTRWATHGVPSEKNAHPHISKNGIWAVVHNGIIENYKELKKQLKHEPESETDTAVVAELLEEKNVENIFGFIDTFSNICGSYAIAAICQNKNDTMFLVRQKSPLYVGVNAEQEFLIASDPICFAKFCDKYYEFDDGEFAYISDKNIEFFDTQKNKINKELKILNTIFEETEKGMYPHFMLKEIMQEKDAILRQINIYKSKNILSKYTKEYLSNFEEIKFIGCGTAYHAGLMGAKFVQKILGKKASAEIASEFIYSKPNFVNPKTLYIFVSQSGETADTLRSLEVIKNSKATSIALTNVLYSSLAKKADHILPICAGVEIAVASTKAYVCMLSAILLFCAHAKSESEFQKTLKKLKNLAEQILNFDRQKIKQIANKISAKKEAIFIGKDMDYITALEASLKLKEVSYINANSYPSGELKHGFLALVEQGTPLFVFALNRNINHKTHSSASEAVSRGAEVIMFANERYENFGYQFLIEDEDEFLLELKAIAPMQYLAYEVSVQKGINPDQPRNLAKSVTVE